MKRAIAIDWSGAKAGARSKIWLAEVRDGRLTRLESGRDRRKVVAHVIRDADADPDVVVGLDFAFSIPGWFAEELGAKLIEELSIEELWNLVAEQGEDWLRNCPDPFWGKPGRGKPNLPEHFRQTEERAPKLKGSNPKSVFQIGGAGTVGTGSIRGMPHLATLRTAGFSIWPFHEVQPPLVIEIYPRLLTGPVNKSDAFAREAYLAQGFPEIDDALAHKAASSEDAFDAAVSAVVMSRHVDEISTLTASRDPTALIEGRIPRAHAETLFAQSAEIQADVWRLVAKVRDKLQSEFKPDGFNVGLNDGQAAGQTVTHAHVHLIPRFDGDVTDPRGGIRWVVPERAAYWDQ